MLTPEQIENNWNIFEKLCEKTGDRSEAIEKMLTEMGERACITPASGRESYHCAYPGGLIDHTLRVFDNARNLRKSFDFFSDIPIESVIIASLFHDWGKVGDPGQDGTDYYVEQTSDWHREKLGEHYKYNDDIDYMKTSLRSICTLQSYGIILNQDEFLAIYLHDGPIEDKNKPYMMKEPKLATLIHMADHLATKMEKEFIKQ